MARFDSADSLSPTACARFSRSRFHLSALVWMMLVGSPYCLHATEPVEDASGVIERLREWRRTFSTIQLEWYRWSEADFLEANPKIELRGSLEGQYCARETFAWADWGAFRRETIVLEAGKSVLRTALGTDGNRPWGADTNYRSDQVRWASIQYWVPVADRPLSSNTNTGVLNGLWFAKDGLWIDEFLVHAGAVTVIGNEDLDSHACLVVEAEQSWMQTGLDGATKARKNFYRFWLDHQHAFLPRRLEVRVPKDDQSVVFYTWTVSEFQTFQGRTSFPVRGNLVVTPDEPPGQEWHITKVILNESLGKSFFAAPRPSPGTNVIDIPGGNVYRGNAPLPTTTSKPRAGAFDTGTLVSQPPLEALPDRFSWYWLMIVGVVLAVFGVVLRLRKRG